MIILGEFRNSIFLLGNLGLEVILELFSIRFGVGLLILKSSVQRGRNRAFEKFERSAKHSASARIEAQKHRNDIIFTHSIFSVKCSSISFFSSLLAFNALFNLAIVSSFSAISSLRSSCCEINPSAFVLEWACSF